MVKGDNQTHVQDNDQQRSAYTSGPAGGSGDQLTMARNLMRDLNLTAAQGSCWYCW